MKENQSTTALVKLLLEAKKIAVLTGSGISAESGIPTFRGKDGLWKNFRAQELATPAAFSQNPKLVWEWYDWRRGIIADKKPNQGHKILVEWEKYFSSFFVISQNIDGLHQKAGTQNILELHGNIWKTRCTEEGTIQEIHETPLKVIPLVCTNCGALLRPHVVWFGESLDGDILQKAFSLSSECDLLFVIGTSAEVHPAASLPLKAAESGAKVVEINPNITPLSSFADFSFRGKAGEIMPKISSALKKARVKKNT